MSDKMTIKYLLHRLRVGLHNKWWLLKNKFRQSLTKLQLYWLLSQGSQPLNVNQKSVIVFSPHQDDEALGCGGMIALKREQGIPIKVVFVTDGGGSHFGHTKITRSEIVEIRRKEALAALEILGVESKDVHFLNKLDGALYRMTESEQHQTIEEIAQLLQTFKPQEVYVTHKQDRSSDHEIAYNLVKAAINKAEIKLDLWEYPIWLLWESLLFRDLKFDELVGAHRVAIHQVHSKKKQAIETYRSQYLPIDAKSSPILTRAFLWQFFLSHEIFFKSEQ
jgi:LmbE family N-acetylglucosaminyl deacetylase